MEVELGTYAQQHANSPAVKQFGEQMIKDHSKDRDELKMFASKKDIPFRTYRVKNSKAHQ